MNIQSDTFTDAEVKQFLRNAAEDSGKVFYTAHAEQRAAERDIDRLDVIRILRAGAIVEGPYFDNSKGNYRLTVEGKTSGRWIRVAVAVQPVEPENRSFAVIVTVI
ncbi:DUF4258 domain-containing protein [Alkalimonas sp. NCh-2]|uniref:DUF4258 domain-containing protein n=1 Tax=Alkalimonas sp. NCh-2 TaxID=3144846 RepID=UPI0031F671B9